jgi:hypothetical protein
MAGKKLQSSSGVIVVHGPGIDGMDEERGRRRGVPRAAAAAGPAVAHEPQAWDAQQLTFAVREPFPSRSSQAELVFGHVTRELAALTLRSRMPEHGVIFSDGIESDFLRFTAGLVATVTVSAATGQLAV